MPSQLGIVMEYAAGGDLRVRSYIMKTTSVFQGNNAFIYPLDCCLLHRHTTCCSQFSQ